MVVSPRPSLSVTSRRAPRRTPLRHNGQRRWALAVRDYESRALPLSHGGVGHLTYSRVTRCGTHYRQGDEPAVSSTVVSLCEGRPLRIRGAVEVRQRLRPY